MNDQNIRDARHTCLFSPHLSGSVLKLIAVISMLIDHAAAAFLYNVPAESQIICTLWGHSFIWYDLMRGIGRLAFPIFCFLLVEGFRHTRNRLCYGRNLLLFALLSEIPWNLLHYNHPLYIGSQNVFFTLFLGFLGMTALEELSDRHKRFAALALLTAIASFLHADYGVRGFLLPVLLYALRQQKEVQAMSICGLLYTTWPAWLSLIPIGLYNGQRGFLKGPVGKYAFYLIYPVHMVFFYLLKYRIL